MEKGAGNLEKPAGMIYKSDISQVLKEWEERLHGTSHSPDYRIALEECIYDLNKAMEASERKSDYMDVYLDL